MLQTGDFLQRTAVNIHSVVRMPRKNVNAAQECECHEIKKVFIFPFSGRLSKAFHTVINNYDGIKSI